MKEISEGILGRMLGRFSKEILKKFLKIFKKNSCRNLWRIHDTTNGGFPEEISVGISTDIFERIPNGITKSNNAKVS